MVKKIYNEKFEIDRELTIASSHYKENLDWLKLFVNNKHIKIVICDKEGADDIPQIFKNSICPITKNCGNEASAYFNYIVNNYNDLTDYTAFIHGHEEAYHQTKSLNDIFINKLYVNHDYFELNGMRAKDWYLEADNLHFNNLLKLWDKYFKTQLNKQEPPKKLCGDCCAQFILSKKAIKNIPLDTYKLWLDLTLNPEKENLNCRDIGYVFEYLWHVIFTNEFCYTNHNDFELVIASPFKNESHIMDEWIRHHIFHGVQHFYLINDNSNDNFMPIIEKYSDKITLFNNDLQIDTYPRQKFVYEKYLRPILNKSKWWAIIDLDEFLYSPYDLDIKNILKKYDKEEQLFVYWKMFGSNGLIDQPKYVVPSFTKRKIDLGPNGKSIIKGNSLVNFDIHSHEVKNNNSKTVDDLFINHYCLQSWNFFKRQKMTRGDMDNFQTRDKKYFDAHDFNETEDLELYNQNRILYSDIKVCVIQCDNRPDLKYLQLTKKVNEMQCKKVDYEYKYININPEDTNLIINNDIIKLHPATSKILLINNYLQKSTDEIIVFLDSDAWIQNPYFLQVIISKLYQSDKQGCFSRDPYIKINTYINSGSFILKVNEYTKEMYKQLIDQLLIENMYHNWWPYDQYYLSNFVYNNRNDFFIFVPDILNTPSGIILRHNWRKNQKMYDDLNNLLNNDLIFDKSINLDIYIDNNDFPNNQEHGYEYD